MTRTRANRQVRTNTSQIPPNDDKSNTNQNEIQPKCIEDPSNDADGEASTSIEPESPESPESPTSPTSPFSPASTAKKLSAMGEAKSGSASQHKRDSRSNMLRYLARVPAFDDPSRAAIDVAIWTPEAVQRQLIDAARLISKVWGIKPSFIRRYLDCHPVHTVEWRYNQTNRKISSHSNHVLSVIGQSCGLILKDARACIRCQEGKGPFTKCTILNVQLMDETVAALSGVCANCFYHGHPDVCSFHNDYAGPPKTAWAYHVDPSESLEAAAGLAKSFYPGDWETLDVTERSRYEKMVLSQMQFKESRLKKHQPKPNSTALKRTNMSMSIEENDQPKKKPRATQFCKLDSLKNRPISTGQVEDSESTDDSSS